MLHLRQINQKVKELIEEKEALAIKLPFIIVVLCFNFSFRFSDLNRFEAKLQGETLRGKLNDAVEKLEKHQMMKARRLKIFLNFETKTPCQWCSSSYQFRI